ncbi:MAG: glycosyltransferase [Candidatus Methanomethylicaceae archaeon]
MRIAFVVGGFYTEASGIARAVASLANCLASIGHQVTLFVPSYRGKDLATSLLNGGVKVVTAKGYWLFRLGLSPGLRRILSSAIAEFDVVHTHSLWMLPTHYATSAALRHKVPVVASIQGFLDPWALSRSRIRKKVASLLYQRKDLVRAAVLHAVTEAELAQIAAYIKPRRVAVIPNGVDEKVIHLALDGRSGSHYRSAFTCVNGLYLNNRKIVLFLSRLHVKKGLDLLLDAWNSVAPHFPDWHLVIVGPDDGFGSFVRRFVETHALGESVTILPPCYGEAKLSILKAAELFVLPSRSEGLPMALLEALGAGKPVVYTTGCYFPEAARVGAGIEVPSEASAIAHAMVQVMSLSPPERTAMGIRGHELIKSKYTWKHVAHQFEELYAWLKRGLAAPLPSFVRVFDG